MPTHAQNLKMGLEGWFGDTWIHSAAILLNGKVYAGLRHHMITQKMAAQKIDPTTGIVGFLTNKGEFISPEKAMGIAMDNFQISAKRWNQFRLVPEELWNTDPTEYAAPIDLRGAFH